MKRYATIVALALLASTLSIGAVLASNDGSDQNKVSYWCEDGVKYEPVDTPYVVPTPPEGTAWTLLVLKAGSGDGANETVANPTSGQSYTHSTEKDISHVILCWEETEDTTTSTSTTSSTSTSSTTSSTSSTSSTTSSSTSTTTTAPKTTTSSSTTTTTAGSTTSSLAPTTTSTTSTSSSTVPQTTTTEIEETTTTSVPPSTTTTTLGELPMTGPEGLWPFAVAGAAMLALGGIAVWAVREQQ